MVSDLRSSNDSFEAVVNPIRRITDMPVCIRDRQVRVVAYLRARLGINHGDGIDAEVADFFGLPNL
jgi:hypothetical protein